MSKRKKVSVIVANNRHAFKHHRNIVPILTGTFHTSCTQQGVICISGSAAGAGVGNCYLAIDTAGTGTVIND
jgi:hypothetical protein